MCGTVHGTVVQYAQDNLIYHLLLMARGAAAPPVSEKQGASRGAPQLRLVRAQPLVQAVVPLAVNIRTV